MSEELKPCPFCGGKPDTFWSEKRSHLKWSVICNDHCLAEGPMCSKEAAAIEAWNSRPNCSNTLIEEQAARIAELEQKLRTTSMEALAISDTNNELAAKVVELEKERDELKEDNVAYFISEQYSPTNAELGAAERRYAIAEARLSEAVKVLERAETALNDWLNIYASDLCEENRVAEAHKRVSEHGTIGYIADVTAEIRAAKAFIATLGEEK